LPAQDGFLRSQCRGDPGLRLASIAESLRDRREVAVVRPDASLGLGELARQSPLTAQSLTR